MFLLYIKNAARPCSPRLFLCIITIFRLPLSAATRSDKCVWDIFYSFVKKLTAAGGRRSNRADGAAIGRAAQQSGGPCRPACGHICHKTGSPVSGKTGSKRMMRPPHKRRLCGKKLPRASVIRKAAAPAPRARHIPIGAPPRRGRPQAPTAPRPGRPAGATRAVRARFGRKATTVRKDMYAT